MRKANWPLVGLLLTVTATGCAWGWPDSWPEWGEVPETEYGKDCVEWAPAGRYEKDIQRSIRRPWNYGKPEPPGHGRQCLRRANEEEEERPARKAVYDFEPTEEDYRRLHKRAKGVESPDP